MDQSALNIDWVSPENTLILNPRLFPETRARFWSAWKRLVELEQTDQIGIATSGSSSDSIGKLIVLSKSAILLSAAMVNNQYQIVEKDIWMKTLPDFHVGGLSIFARAHLTGSTVVESRLERWDAKAFHQELTQSQANLLSLVPTQLYDLIKQNLKAPIGMKAVFIGGGALTRELHDQALALGWPILPSYGMTECSSQIATARSPMDARLFPLPHVDVRIAKESESDKDGRIEIRSAALLTGQIVFQGENAVYLDPKRDGWLRTEDRGRLANDGSLIIHGRTQDFVKVGGEGVQLPRLQEILKNICGEVGFAGDAEVLAASDERLGGRIVLLTNANALVAQALTERFNSQVMPFERIRTVHQILSLPRSPLGKLLRNEALAQVGLKPASND